MTDIVSLEQLRTRGLEAPEVRRLVRSGALERIRPGAYAPPLPDDSARERHRRMILATVPQLADGAVVSHGSAALLHGLPVWNSAISHVHATRSRSHGGNRRHNVHVHAAPMAAQDIVVVDGVAVTSLARTVVDLGRTRVLSQSVAAGDRALANGLDPLELYEVLLRMEHWPGVRQGRRAVDLLDPGSESAGESATRVELIGQGVPRPEVQKKIRNSRGRVIARCDVGWEEHRTVGEFDGKIKYGRLLEPGIRPEDVVYKEKLREDAIRDEGWQVVRWTWDDLRRPEDMRDRVLRAFARAAAAGGPAATAR